MNNTGKEWFRLPNLSISNNLNAFELEIEKGSRFKCILL